MSWVGTTVLADRKFHDICKNPCNNLQLDWSNIKPQLIHLVSDVIICSRLICVEKPRVVEILDFLYINLQFKDANDDYRLEQLIPGVQQWLL